MSEVTRIPKEIETGNHAPGEVEAQMGIDNLLGGHDVR